MSGRLAWNGYGKAGIRLVKVERGGTGHRLHDLTVDVRLEGRFGPAHTAGDNSAVLPTDTMKNTVYALARGKPVEPPEEFGERLARHFLAASAAAERAVISLAVHRWERVSGEGPSQESGFTRGTAERRLATVTVDGDGTAVEAGLDGLGLLRTSGSAFAGFLRDAYTTLEDTDDRIMASDVEARWKYSRPPRDYGAAWSAARSALVETFAGHPSASVQHTLYAMGEAALARCPEIATIRLVLPNRHHLRVDLTPFGLDNPGEIFVATEQPYGRIEAVVERGG